MGVQNGSLRGSAYLFEITRWYRCGELRSRYDLPSIGSMPCEGVEAFILILFMRGAFEIPLSLVGKVGRVGRMMKIGLVRSWCFRAGGVVRGKRA